VSQKTKNEKKPKQKTKNPKKTQEKPTQQNRKKN